MTLRIVVVDDEPPARARLVTLIEQHALGEVVAQAGDGRAALDAVRTHGADLVLLDIRMPVMDGLEAAHHLVNDPCAPRIIFTTAYDEHALAAFDAGAVDYLLKPIRASRLTEAVARAQRVTPNLLPPADKARTHLSATLHDQLRLVALKDVRLFRAEHKYVTVVHPDGELVLEESLTALEREFAEEVLRVHRNALVMRRHVKGLRKNGAGVLEVELDAVEDAVEVSRRLAGDVRRQLRGGS